MRHHDTQQALAANICQATKLNYASKESCSSRHAYQHTDVMAASFEGAA